MNDSKLHRERRHKQFSLCARFAPFKSPLLHLTHFKKKGRISFPVTSFRCPHASPDQALCTRMVSACCDGKSTGYDVLKWTRLTFLKKEKCTQTSCFAELLWSSWKSKDIALWIMLDPNVLCGIFLYKRAQSVVLEIVVNHFFERKF